MPSGEVGALVITEQLMAAAVFLQHRSASREPSVPPTRYCQRQNSYSNVNSKVAFPAKLFIPSETFDARGFRQPKNCSRQHKNFMISWIRVNLND